MSDTGRGLDMKGDWDRRARENARYFIATTNWESEEIFRRSGESDVRHFFSDLEHLLTREAEVLDVGGGIGRMDAVVAPRVGRLTLLDVSSEMLERARARLAALSNVTFVEGDGRTLAPLADASFDLVFSHIVFHHVPRAVFASYLPEVRRVLRAGGSFVFQLPEAVDRDLPDPPEEDTFELRFYREAALRAQLEAAGFEWRSCKRFRVGTADLPVDHLRVHAQAPA